MTTTTLTAANGIAFTARLIRPGDGYGRDGTGPVTLAATEAPQVEFYDTRYRFTEFGQFTGGRYYASTFLDGSGGVDLMGYVRDWKIDADTAEKFRTWLRAALTDQEVTA